MPNNDPNQRIKFAYRLDGWSYNDGDSSLLREEAERIPPSEYTADMEGNIFCPVCYTNLIRTPKDKGYFSNGRKAFFAHMGKYKNIPCNLRTSQAEGKHYDNFEEAQRAIDNERLVIVSVFLKDMPKTSANPTSTYDETAVEDENGPLSQVPISRHNGETFQLPSTITTVAGICRNFDQNLYRHYYLPKQNAAVRLVDLLRNINDVTEQNDRQQLFYGTIREVYSPNPQKKHLRMIELDCHKNVRDFTLKATVEMCESKGITKESKDRIILMYGQVTKSGIGLSIEKLGWGEFALLPQQYNKLLAE